MPRVSRKNIPTQYVHIMVQGNNKEFIFKEDCLLKYYLKQVLVENNASFSLLAYCMMNNHAHFLYYIMDFNEFSKFMHRINQKYVSLYNKKMSRCGVVFRNRYQAEPIMDEVHLYNCIKYIHNNPVKAGIVANCEDYPYSSYNDYKNKTGIFQNGIVAKMLNVDDIIEFIDNSKNTRFMDIDGCDIYDFVVDGISQFLTKNNNFSLGSIFESRDTFIKLIVFLNKECGLKLYEIRDFFAISEYHFKMLFKT